ncbi:MAG TPA: TonB family protein [Pyrinomonadaceae bacterium]|jgi:TonB family protein
MKTASLPRTNLKRLYLAPFFLLSLIFSLNTFSNAQSPQLSLADILIALRSKKVTLAERNKLLADAVKERGITFALSPEIEKELANTGADKDLVDAIRQKSPQIKPVSLPQPTPAPTPIPTPTPPDFTFYQKRAVGYIVKGEYDLAVSDYNKVIELKPDDASTYLNRGLAFYNKKSYDLAISDYNKAIELNPKDATAYMNRGESYEKQGNLSKAASDYQKAVDLDASNEMAKAYLQRLQAEQAKLAVMPTQQNQPTTQNKETPAVTETSKTPQTLEIGQLNALAVNLTMPTYPEIARKTNVKGTVTVQITLDEDGKIISAKATEGPAMLRSAAEDAARKSKFKPAKSGDKTVRASGFIVYNFKGN